MKHSGTVIGLSCLLLQVSLSGCGFGKKAAPPALFFDGSSAPVMIYIYRDTTRSEQQSATVRDADAFVVSTAIASFKKAATKNCRVQGELFTSPPLGQAVGASRSHLAWENQRLNPDDKDALLAQCAGQWQAVFQKIEAEPSVAGESAILENIADVAGQMSGSPDASKATRILVVITDLEQYNAKGLTAAKITSASEADFQKILDDIKQKYPPVPNPPQKVVFVVTTLTERSTEQQRTRLRTFWEKVCQGWGVREVQFINPPSQATPEGQPSENHTRSQGSGFQETAKATAAPTLSITNETRYRSVFTLRSQTENTETKYELPVGKTTVLTLSEGHFQWSLDFPGKELASSKGSCKFRPYHAYRTDFSDTPNGTPLTFGETQ